MSERGPTQRKASWWILAAMLFIPPTVVLLLTEPLANRLAASADILLLSAAIAALAAATFATYRRVWPRQDDDRALQGHLALVKFLRKGQRTRDVHRRN